jgi:predicted ATP-binding protein involved in virulence
LRKNVALRLKSIKIMRLKEIHLTNFRCFEQLDVQLNDRLAVFLGVNGAGKTAILDAINRLYAEDYVANFFNNQTIDNHKKAEIESHNNMRIGSTRSSMSMNFEIDSDTEIKWNLEFAFPNLNSFEYSPSTNEIFNWVHQFNKKSEKNPLINLPLFAFYKSEKATDFNDENFLLPNNIKLKQLWAFKNVFRNEKDSFNNFLNWFDEETNYENSIRLEKDNAYRNPKLQILRHSIGVFLDKLTGSSFKNLKIRKVRDYIFDPFENALIITKDDLEIDVNQLSAGEKSVVLLIADLAMRLTIANPSLENPLEGEGIVLIDEIDLHLHPQWQRNILPALLATFPKCQFIVTTHSPLVISNVARESVFILDNGKLVKNTPHTLGRDYASILYNVFGVEERPAEYQKKLDACFRLLENEQYPEAKILLKKLSKELGEDDIDIVRANVILDMEA